MITGKEPAFAIPSTGHLDSFMEGSEGLTKREYFAAMALASGSSVKDSVAKADALIRELNKEKK